MGSSSLNAALPNSYTRRIINKYYISDTYRYGTERSTIMYEVQCTKSTTRPSSSRRWSLSKRQLKLQVWLSSASASSAKRARSSISTAADASSSSCKACGIIWRQVIPPPARPLTRAEKSAKLRCNTIRSTGGHPHGCPPI